MLFDASGSGSRAPGGMISHPSREASPATTERVVVRTAAWIQPKLPTQSSRAPDAGAKLPRREIQQEPR
jgi:hypothetical protein